MKREDALVLENQTEEKIAKLLEINREKIEVSLTLGNKFSVTMKENVKYLFSRKDYKLVSFKTEYFLNIEEFEKHKINLEIFLEENKQDINLLLWSYDNQKDLT